MDGASIEQRIALAIERFGTENILVSHLIEASVICTLTRQHSTLSDIQRVSGRLALQIFDSAHVDIIDGLNAAECTNLATYVFSNADYDQRYSQRWQQYTEEIRHSFCCFRGNSDPYRKFIFVIGPNFQWRHLSIAQPLEVTLSGRRRSNNFPFHPFLTTDIAHTVLCAGELSILWPDTSDFPHLIYINNISGHFLPRNLTASQLLNLCGMQAPISRQTRVVSICNNGAAIYARGRSE